jgi:hypothetical protein
MTHLPPIEVTRTRNQLLIAVTRTRNHLLVAVTRTRNHLLVAVTMTIIRHLDEVVEVNHPVLLMD